MDNDEVKQELPSNYEQLKKSVNRESNWRERLAAVEELGQWKSKQTIAILMHRMTNDAVYRIQEAAFHQLQGFGEDVQLPERKKGNLFEGLSKVLIRVKKSLPAGHSFAEFKEKLQKMRLDVYDTYEGDKGAEFDKWLESVWVSLSTR